jgi:hypothetical protein
VRWIGSVYQASFPPLIRGSSGGSSGMKAALFIAGLLLFAGSGARANEGFGELTVDQVDQAIQSKSADIFDNNSKGDWVKGHVPTAKWVSFKDVKESDLPKDKNRELVFYCHNEH